MENEAEKRLAEIKCNRRVAEDVVTLYTDEFDFLVSQAERINELGAELDKAKALIGGILGSSVAQVQSYYQAQERAKEAEAEIDRLHKHMKNITQIEYERDRALAELTRLSKVDAAKEAVIQNYAGHGYGCELDQTEFCTCGYSEALAALHQSKIDAGKL